MVVQPVSVIAVTLLHVAVSCLPPRAHPVLSLIPLIHLRWRYYNNIFLDTSQFSLYLHYLPHLHSWHGDPIPDKYNYI